VSRADENAEQRWRLGPYARAAYGLACVGFLAVGIGETAVAGWDGLVVLGFAPIVGLFFWRQALVPYVALTAQALIVQNPYNRQLVPYSDIETVDVGAGNLPLKIRLRTGEVAVPWCIQPSIGLGANKYRRAESVAAAIKTRLASGRPGSP